MKQLNPTNPIFNLDLTEIKLDDADFVTVSKSLQKLVREITLNLLTFKLSEDYECILRDFSTLFSTIYKSFATLIDVTYLIGGYTFGQRNKDDEIIYYTYFNKTLKGYFLRDYKKMKSIFSK